jgi:hypothetical protein
MRAPKARLNGLEGRGQATGSLGGGEHQSRRIRSSMPRRKPRGAGGTGAPRVLPGDGFSRARDSGRAPCNEEGEADGESDPTTPR